MEYCGGVLWAYDWTRRKITALPFSDAINGSCNRVDVADLMGTSADADAWTRSIEGYNVLRALGWSKPVLCNISYYKAMDVCLAQDQCTGGQFKDCAFQNPDGSFTECPSVMTHQCVNGVLVATGRECVDCREPEPTCQQVEVVCSDGTVIVTQECIANVLTPTGRICPSAPVGSSFAYDYKISRSGSTYYAVDASGVTVYSGTSAHLVINWAIGTGGSQWDERVVVIEAGTDVVLTSPIVMQNYTRLKCEEGVTITESGQTQLAYCNLKNHFAIEGGEWISTYQAVSSQNTPFYFNSPSYATLKNLKVRDSWYHNIIVVNSDHFTMDGVESYKSWPFDQYMVHDNTWQKGYDAVAMLRNTTNALIQNCNFHDCGHGGIYIFTGEAREAYHADDNIIRNCIVARCGRSGISISQRTPNGTGDRNLIEFNTVTDCGIDTDHPLINVGYGSANPCSNNVVRNNIVVDNGIVGPTGTGADSGININGTANEVYDNDIQGCTASIYVQSGSGHLVDSNYIHDIPGEVGIVLDCSNSRITNNRFHNVGTMIDDNGSGNVKTGNGTDENELPSCNPETYVCEDGTVIVTKQCVNGALVETGATCPFAEEPVDPVDPEESEKPVSPALYVGIAAAVALLAGGAYIAMKR